MNTSSGVNQAPEGWLLARPGLRTVPFASSMIPTHRPQRSRSMRHLKFAAPMLIVATSLTAQQPAAKHGFTPADWYKVTTVSTPALSPDGNKVAITVTTVREAENRRHSEVWVVSTQGDPAPTRYTSPAFESSNPRFSDDGTLLYFTSQRPGGRGTNWALRMDQPSGEAFQPTGTPQIRTGSSPADNSFSIVTEGGRGGFGGRGGGGGRGGRGGGAPDSSATDSMTNDPFGRMAPISRPPYNAITRPE